MFKTIAFAAALVSAANAWGNDYDQGYGYGQRGYTAKRGGYGGYGDEGYGYGYDGRGVEERGYNEGSFIGQSNAAAISGFQGDEFGVNRVPTRSDTTTPGYGLNMPGYADSYAIAEENPLFDNKNLGKGVRADENIEVIEAPNRGDGEAGEIDTKEREENREEMPARTGVAPYAYDVSEARGIRDGYGVGRGLGGSYGGYGYGLNTGYGAGYGNVQRGYGVGNVGGLKKVEDRDVYDGGIYRGLGGNRSDGYGYRGEGYGYGRRGGYGGDYDAGYGSYGAGSYGAGRQLGGYGGYGAGRQLGGYGGYNTGYGNAGYGNTGYGNTGYGKQIGGYGRQLGGYGGYGAGRDLEISDGYGLNRGGYGGYSTGYGAGRQLGGYGAQVSYGGKSYGGASYGRGYGKSQQLDAKKW